MLGICFVVLRCRGYRVTFQKLVHQSACRISALPCSLHRSASSDAGSTTSRISWYSRRRSCRRLWIAIPRRFSQRADPSFFQERCSVFQLGTSSQIGQQLDSQVAGVDLIASKCLICALAIRKARKLNTRLVSKELPTSSCASLLKIQVLLGYCPAHRLV